MRLPVSRLAFDLVREERDTLRRQVEQLQDQLLRLRRREAHMPEVPRQQQAPQQIEDMPPEVLTLLRGFESEAIRTAMEEDIRRARKAGTPWTEIVSLLRADLEGDT